MIRHPRTFAQDTKGAVTIEFLLVFLTFIGLIMFVVETTIYLFFMASLEKAAEAGARAAATRAPVVAYNRTIGLRSDGALPNPVMGTSCSDASEPCVPPADAICDGCLSSGGSIFKYMKGFNGLIQPSNVRITYRDSGIGFAGGPSVPMVTVTISGVAYRTGIMGLILRQSMPAGLGTLPTRSATIVGEDLRS